MKTRTFFLTLFILGTTISFAQKSKIPAQPELESGTIESQMTYIIEKSSSFKDFQLIRKTSILKVKDNIMDSLSVVNESLKNAKAEVGPLKAKIEQLEKQIEVLNIEVAAANEQVDAISVLGKPVEKSLYNTIMWIVVAVLLLALIFIMLRFKSINALTKRTRLQLEKSENEFESFRKKSLKKEQEIMRKLQDEINKNNP